MSISSPIRTPQKPPVLVVDDEFGPRESIAYSLSQGFSVDAVARAADGLAMLRDKRYDVVVMDIRMPEMDGIRAVSELRKIDPFVSVVMLTGYGTLQTAQQAMLAGANQYLRKPPDVLELIEAVSRQAVESRLRRTQAEAAKSAVEMNHALRKEMSAVAPSVWLGKASAELVHDISNPLTIVIGYADLLASELQAVRAGGGAVPDHLLQYSGVIKNAAEYCRHLSQNWRRASGEVPRMEILDIKVVIADSVALLFEKRAEIEIRSGGEVAVKGARYELMRVIQNVLKNSLEAGSSSVVVDIEVVGGAQVLVSFTDNGSGMSDVQKAAIGSAGVSFKPEGTGLGLGICRHIMAAHGGSFALSSEAGVGTTVRLTFPLAAI